MKTSPPQPTAHHRPDGVRVTIAAGGTAGHLAPALAVADELAGAGCAVTFITSAGRGDEARVAARGYDATPFTIGGLPRRPGLAQLRAAWRAVTGVLRCIGIVRSQRPDVLLAGGGFVSAPAAIAARLLRVPVVVTEADAHLGLANRISARVARRLCTAYPLPNFRRRQVVTGRPVADAFLHVDAAAARAAIGIAPDQRLLVVVGGSGGALRLNTAAWDAYGSDPDPRAGDRELVVVHVTGARDHDRFTIDAPASPRYRVLRYCDDMPQVLAAADLVVSRAGGSVFEIAAVGRAAVLVPSPNVTADHQTANARFFADRGGALLEADATFTGERLRALSGELLAPAGDRRRAELAEGMAALSRPDAARAIAQVVAGLGAAHAGRGEEPGPLAGVRSPQARHDGDREAVR